MPIQRPLFVALAWLAPCVLQAHVVLSHPVVEHTSDPSAISTTQPRFGWVIESDGRHVQQTRYRILVASSQRQLDSGKGDIWDSGTVASAQSFDIAYAGPALAQGTGFVWKAIVDTSDGRATTQGRFATGLQDWGASAWIGKPAGGTAAPLLRKAFAVAPGLQRAVLYVAAGGYANATLNGRPVSDAVLSPGFTDYDKRLQYVATDVTAQLRPGADNVLGVELGRGFYGMTNPNVWHWEKAPWHGEPRVRSVLRLQYADGRHNDIVSDASWQVHDGPTMLDDLYGGETYDARLALPGFDTAGFDAHRWPAAVVLPSPKGVLEAQVQQPIRVVQTLHATNVSQPRAGVWVFTFPRVIAGWATMTASGAAGSTIVATYGEKLLPDGQADVRDEHHYFKHGFQTDRFTLSGQGTEQWHATFSYKGFRYVQVEGWPGSTPPLDAVTAQVVHTDVATTGHFDSASPLLNWIHDAAVNTMLNNMYGIPTDTPMYEKNGWTGDGMVGADMFLRNFDAGRLLAKWVNDIADTRTAAGAPLLIAPNPGWGTGRAPTWHSAYVLVPWSLWMHTGDRRVLEANEQGMAAYVDMEYARSPGGIADTDLGDWVSPQTDPGGENAPEDKRVAATAYLYRMATTMASIERVLGNDARARHFDEMAETVRSAFNHAFFDVASGTYRGQGDSGYRQAHNLFALAFGLAREGARARVAKSIADNVHAQGDHLDTGALATKIILPVLTDNGFAAEAWRVATQTTFPSWGFWRDNGATSLWEHWKLASRSRGHYFLGTIDDWLYGDVAGLAPAAPGWQVIRFRPSLTASLDHASASTFTPYGATAIAWRKTSGRVEVTIDVPVGASGQVELPGKGAVTEGGHAIDSRACGDNRCLTVGSGHYLFSVAP